MPRKRIAKKRATGIVTPVVDTTGEAVGTVTLPKEVFGATVNEKLLAQAMHIYRIRSKQGTVATKTRGQVRGSTRKIFRQKGTGRARHGDRKAPIFVGGGVAHGPKSPGTKPVLTKTMRLKALCAALTSKLNEGMLTIVDGFVDLPGKTKALVQAMKNIGLSKLGKQETALLVTAKGANNNLVLAGRNLSIVKVVQATELCVSEVLSFRRLVITKEAIAYLLPRLTKKVEKPVPAGKLQRAPREAKGNKASRRTSS